MAIARLSMKVGASGKAGPHAAYIAREGAYATRLEHGERLEATESGNMPAWARHAPQAFWKASDAFERANGTTYREMEIALPRELSSEQRVELMRSWVSQELGDQHTYQWAIHVPKAVDGGEQPHAHLMFSERRLDGIDRDPEQYFKRFNAKNPEKGGARKLYGETDPALAKGPERVAARAAELKALRSRWADHCNQALERAGEQARIDMRSHADRRTGEVPEKKMLPGTWSDPIKRGQVIDFREARMERQAAQREVRALIPHAGAEIVRILAFQQRRADQRRWESLSLADLRLEDAQLRPVPVDTLMQRRPEFLALFDRKQKAEQDRAAADALLAKHTPAYERWQSQHPMQAWLHRRGLWRDKHVDQVEALMEQQKQRKAAAEATIALTQTEVWKHTPTWKADAELTHAAMAERYGRFKPILQGREDQYARERAEQQAREAAEQAIKVEARRLADQLVMAAELRKRGRLEPGLALAKLLDVVDQIPGHTHEKKAEFAKSLESNTAGRQALRNQLEPHRHQLERHIHQERGGMSR